MFAKEIDTSAPIHPLLASRWSGVAFDPDRPIGEDELRSMIEAARWAPSAFGDEPWRFVVCNKATSPESWRRAFECLGEGNKAWCENVPVLLLVCHDTALTRNDKPNPWAQYDAGAASVSLALQAASLGIMVHQMAGFDTEAAREVFNVPERYIPLVMVAAGYQVAEVNIAERFVDRENGSRARNPIGESFFAGTWGEAF
jgi:nitroreductase